jgi:bacterioferritin
VCVLRYKRHYYMAAGIHASAVADEFLEHATAEQRHVDQIAERITQLGGEPDLNPGNLASRSHSEYVEGKGLTEMIREDLAEEEDHANDLRTLLESLGKDEHEKAEHKH